MTYIQILSSIKQGDYQAFVTACELHGLQPWSLHGFVRLEYAAKEALKKHPSLAAENAIVVEMFSESLTKTNIEYVLPSCGGCGGGAVI